MNKKLTNQALRFLLALAFPLVAIAAGLQSCSETQDPPPVYKGYTDIHQGVILLPSDGGSVAIDLSSPKEEYEIPIDLLATSPAIPLLPKENWPKYVDTGMALLPEQIYQEAGYASYPNLLDFGYTFHWATFSTYKISGSDNGVLRIAFEENTDETPRTLYLHFNGFYDETVEIRQDGRSSYPD